MTGRDWLRTAIGFVASILVAGAPLVLVFAFTAEPWARWIGLTVCAYLFAVMMRVTRTFEPHADRLDEFNDAP